MDRGTIKSEIFSTIVVVTNDVIANRFDQQHGITHLFKEFAL
jgi:hypothetical protein